MESHVLCPPHPTWEILPSQVSLKSQQVLTLALQPLLPWPGWCPQLLPSSTCAGVELTPMAPASLHLVQPCDRRKANQCKMEAWRAPGVKGSGKLRPAGLGGCQLGGCQD